jgi:hypothetical protein
MANWTQNTIGKVAWLAIPPSRTSGVVFPRQQDPYPRSHDVDLLIPVAQIQHLEKQFQSDFVHVEGDNDYWKTSSTYDKFRSDGCWEPSKWILWEMSKTNI